MITIISFKICPFVQRVTARLEAGSIPYEIRYIELSAKPRWFLERSPTGQVPVLMTAEGEALFESDAIVEYIDEIAPKLHPDLSAVERAQERAWCYQATKLYLAQCSAQFSSDEETLVERSEVLNAGFARMEAALKQRPGPFFQGEQPGNVEAAWVVLLHRAHIVAEQCGYDFLSGYPRLQAWQRAVMSLKLVAASVPSNFEQLFGDFYLSNKTYLGALRYGSSCPPKSVKGSATGCDAGRCCG